MEGDRAFPLLKTNEFAGVPFTVKSVACTVAGFTASLRLTTKSVGCVLMMLLHAGSLVVTAKPTNSLSVKASCWDGRDGHAPVHPCSTRAW